MKLFQRMLVAPAALGLLAPLAANAAEVNMNNVSQFSGQSSASLSAPSSVQFSDVVPGDWAYTALQNLSESYGCVDNAYTQSLKNGQALTRYEAAALINACLDGGLSAEGLTSEATRLTTEFGSEMAILKGRVDGLEFKINELNAGQFSSTTKLKGHVSFNLMGLANGQGYEATDSKVDSNVHMTYRAKYDLYTSFTGEDQLYTRLVAGNGGSSWAENTSLGLHLSDSYGGGNGVTVDKLWYQFPVGDFTVWAGPLVENYYMLASSPSIYKPMLKQFALGGNAATYGSSTDGGFGIAWTQPTDDASQARFAASTNYVAKGSEDSSDGIFTQDTQAKWLSKFEYGSPRWQVSLGIARNLCESTDGSEVGGCKEWADYYATAQGEEVTGNSTAYALRAYWKPEETGIVPEVQFGYDWVSVDDDGTAAETENAAAWMTGLTWKDALIEGNRLGFAFGQPQRATEVTTGALATAEPAEDAFTWELYYDFKVTDGITVTPAIFGATDREDATTDEHDDFFGGILQTTFKF